MTPQNHKNCPFHPNMIISLSNKSSTKMLKYEKSLFFKNKKEANFDAPVSHWEVFQLIFKCH